MLFANTATPDFLQSNGPISSSFELAGIQTDTMRRLQHSGRLLHCSTEGQTSYRHKNTKLKSTDIREVRRHRLTPRVLRQKGFNFPANCFTSQFRVRE